MKIWRFINDKLEKGIPIVLLYVLDSKGSSPGRQGFKMAVAKDSEISGTIGGGIMEHKLVEQARSILQNEEKEIILKPQFHDKSEGKNRSGMICSGNQFVALIPLDQSHKNIIDQIVSVSKERQIGLLEIAPSGISFSKKSNSKSDLKKVFNFENEKTWSYSEPINSATVIHIIGGGHVGLALSEVMNLLGFYIKVYDDRSELNTLEQNRFAQEKIIVDYEKIVEQMDLDEGDFVTIMTFGYRNDKTILKQLYNKKFAYIGMMGSVAKVDQIFLELENEGISKEKLIHVKAPIGINISSKTTMEIAISVAAEIISEKNKFQPSQRKLNTQTMNEQDLHFIKIAIALSEEGMNSNKGGPFGAIIVKDGEIIGRGSNQVTSTNDPTAHAEVTAIRDACKNINDYQLTGCTIYTSCEPCPMCLGAIYWARPDKIVYGCTREDAAAIGFDDDFLYKEVSIPVDQRAIPTIQLGRAEGLSVFKAWEAKEDKIEY